MLYIDWNVPLLTHLREESLSPKTTNDFEACESSGLVLSVELLLPVSFHQSSFEGGDWVVVYLFSSLCWVLVPGAVGSCLLAVCLKCLATTSVNL